MLQKKNFLNISQINPFPLKQIKLINVKYKSNDNYDSNYVFVEDLIDVTIYNIQFLNVIKEENNTFGEIIGEKSLDHWNIMKWLK